MLLFKVIWCLVVILFHSTKASSAEPSISNSSVTGYGFEMILAKLEYLQYKLIEIELTMKEDRETVDQKLTHQETLSDGLLWAINKLSQTMGHNFTAVQSQSNFLLREMSETIAHNLTILQTQSNKMISQQTACANHEQMRKEIQMLGSKGNWTMLKITSESDSKPETIRSCKQEPSKHSGRYLIQPTEKDEPFEGYCDHTSFGGGWLVIQHRFNGSVDFYRNWTEYRNGFGSVDGEFWLGLERIHQLTAGRRHWLLVELKDFSGNYSFALYNDFEIGTEGEQYPLKKLGAYTGTAGDSLNYHKSKKFTTMDRDNDDNSNDNCASKYKGAWWYSNCHHSNLNGLYKNITNGETMSWLHYKNIYMGLAYSRLSIREI